jgi:hypothetical protein
MENDVVGGGVLVALFEPFLDFDAGKEGLAIAKHPRKLELEIIGIVTWHGFVGDNDRGANVHILQAFGNGSTTILSFRNILLHRVGLRRMKCAHTSPF